MLTILKYLEDRKLRIEKEEREYLAKKDKEEEDEKLKVLTAEEKMTSSQCPIRDGNFNCFTACVHFEAGGVFRVKNLYGEISIWVDYPRCKLWK